MGIFILLLIFLLFILLAYVYHTYTTYTVDINKNLELSEDTINNTSKAFNKLEDNVINELAKVNKNQETIVKTLPDNLISLNSNLLNIFEISSNNNKITDITKTKIDYDSLGVTKPFTSYKNFTTITDKDTNFLTICNNRTEIDKKACIRMNIDDSDMFNIYTCNINRNSSNIKGINIYDSNNSILASFDAFNKKIKLGSDINPAILIDNNFYTPNVIVCKCTYSPATIAATSGQINEAIDSTTTARSSITQMLTDLNAAIGTMTFASASSNTARSYYNTANTKKGLADGLSTITILNASTAINYVDEAYAAANSAALLGTSASPQATGISGVNTSLDTIRTNIATARSKIGIASVASSEPKIKLQFISNYPIKKDTFINFPIINNFEIPSSPQQAGNPTYRNKILKFQVVEPNGISANTIFNKEININLINSGEITSMIESTTTGYITAI
jgi:hypothetical protein